jgi:CheY-like chemotaxis protein
MNISLSQTIEILLVEDSHSDAQLIAKVFNQANLPTHLEIVEDGVEALAFLHREGRYSKMPRPNLILLDLNLPKKDGIGVLAAIKADVNLRNIPVIVLTTSDSQEDILNCYQMDANCYLTKPRNLQQFQATIKIIESFWLKYVQLPL